MARRRSSVARGYRSRAQWRKFFADPRLRRHAKKVARRTPGPPKIRYRRLPERRRTGRGRR